MGLCVFQTSEVKRCVQHALAADDFRMAFSAEPPQPAVLFVHDEGVYLMSNGLPADTLIPERNYAAYAQNCHPSIDRDYWDNSRALVGGDDFVEVIPVDTSWLDSCDEFEELHFEVRPEHMDIYFAKPRKIKKAAPV